MHSALLPEIFFRVGAADGKKPGFTERIMTVMFSKSSHSIALLDNYLKVGRR
jgi:hypothetical protein